MCECFLSEHTLCALSAVPSNEFPAASFILSFSHQQKVVIIYSARIFFTHRHAASQNHHSTSNQQKPLLTSIFKIFFSLWESVEPQFKSHYASCPEDHFKNAASEENTLCLLHRGFVRVQRSVGIRSCRSFWRLCAQHELPAPFTSCQNRFDQQQVETRSAAASVHLFIWARVIPMMDFGPFSHSPIDPFFPPRSSRVW